MVNRRTILKALPAAALAPCLSEPLRAAPESFTEKVRSLQLEVIDCHTHFYDPSREQGVPWPARKSPLYRTVLPKHLKALKQHQTVTGTVIVEASKWEEDNQWLLDLAKDDPFIKGIVGNLTPGKADFEKQIRRFARNRLFRGIRIQHALLRKLLDEKRLNGLRLMAKLDLELDVNGGPELLEVVSVAAGQIPDLRFLVNHLANPALVKKVPPADWSRGIKRVAKTQNVFCKVSALVEGASRGGRKAPADLEHYRTYLDTVWNAFGEDRLIYGSNWPVSELFAEYAMLQKIVFEYFEEKGKVALQKFFSGNAKKAYKYLNRK